MDDWLPEIDDAEIMTVGDESVSDSGDPKQPSYFYISMDSIKILLGCKANAEQICAFIIAAKSRHIRSNYLTAGCNVISKCLGIRPQKAKRIYMELPTLVYQGKPLVRLSSPKRTRYSANLRDSGHQQAAIYFPSAFVGHKTASKLYPICKLYSAGDIAARLLLYIQGKLDTDLGGYLLSEESETGHLNIVNGIEVVSGKAPNINMPDAVRKCVVAEGDKAHKGKYVTHWTLEIKEALDRLVSLKLVESVVVAKVYKDERPTECWYDIHVLGDILKGSVRDRIKKVAEVSGVSQGRKDGRSHDKVYHAIAPTGYSVRLCRVIRPVHRHTPSFASMAILAKSRRDRNHTEMMSWLNVLEGTRDIDSIALPHCNPLIQAPEDLGPTPFDIGAMDFDMPINEPKRKVIPLMSDEELARLIEEGDAIIAAELAQQQRPPAKPIIYIPSNYTDEDGY